MENLLPQIESYLRDHDMTKADFSKEVAKGMKIAPKTIYSKMFKSSKRGFKEEEAERIKKIIHENSTQPHTISNAQFQSTPLSRPTSTQAPTVELALLTMNAILDTDTMNDDQKIEALKTFIFKN